MVSDFLTKAPLDNLEEAGDDKSKQKIYRALRIALLGHQGALWFLISFQKHRVSMDSGASWGRKIDDLHQDGKSSVS